MPFSNPILSFNVGAETAVDQDICVDSASPRLGSSELDLCCVSICCVRKLSLLEGLQTVLTLEDSLSCQSGVQLGL